MWLLEYVDRVEKSAPFIHNTEILIHSPYPWCLKWEVPRYGGHCCHLLGCRYIYCGVCCWETCFVICQDNFKSDLEKYYIYFHRKCIFYTVLHMHSHTIVHISKYRPTSYFFLFNSQSKHRIADLSIFSWRHHGEHLHCWILNLKALKKSENL